MTIERRGRKKTRIGTKIITFIIIGLVLLAGITALQNWIKGVLVDARPLSTAVLEDNLEAVFLVIREEHTVFSPFPGTLELIAKAGEKVPKGTVIGYLHKVAGTSLETKSKIPLTAPAAGILSLQIDGLEGICNPQVWSEIDTDKLPDLEKELAENRGISPGKEPAAAGMPLFKIVDNLSPSYLFLAVDQLLDGKFNKGKSIELRVPELGESPIRASISDIYQDKGKTKILLEIPNISNLEKYRKIKGKIILNKHEGIVIPDKMLLHKDGVSGVFLYKNGRAHWQEVTILSKVDNQVAITGLEPGQWIITTPVLVKDGQRVFLKKT